MSCLNIDIDTPSTTFDDLLKQRDDLNDVIEKSAKNDSEKRIQLLLRKKSELDRQIEGLCSHTWSDNDDHGYYKCTGCGLLRSTRRA